ncbi:MAG: hypothetical protein GY757_50870 [bacterium]|nr:hypothetical protein [bacterium]
MSVGLMGMDTVRYEDYAVINYYLELNDFDKAAELVENCLQKFPEDPFLLTEKAFILHDIQRKRGDAIKVLKKSLALYPDYYYSNYLYGSLLFLEHTINRDKETKPGAGKKEAIADQDNSPLLDDALKHLRVSIKNNDQYYESLFLIGVVLSDKKNFKESNAFLKKAFRLKKSIEPFFYMTYNYRRLKDTDAEMRAYKSMLELSPNNYRALTFLSQYFLKKGDLTQAVKYLETLFLQNPEDKKKLFDYLYVLFISEKTQKFMELSSTHDISHSPFLVYGRALLLSRENRLDDSIKLLKGLEKRDFKIKILLADNYRRKQDYYPAYKILDTIDNKEKSFFYYSLQLEILNSMGMNKRILALFDSIKSDEAILEELNLNDYYNIILACGNLNKIQRITQLITLVKTKLKPGKELEQIMDLEQAMKYVTGEKAINPATIKFDLTRYLLLGFYKAQGRFADATTLAKELIRTHTLPTPGPYLELCDIYSRQKMTGDLEKLLTDTGKKFPDSNELKNFLAYSLAVENKQLEYALKLSSDTLAQDSDNLAYIDTYGYILLKMGRTSEAAGFLEKAYLKNPFEQDILEHLVDYYKLDNNTPKIIEIYQKAIDNGVDFKNTLIGKIKNIKK